ASAKAPVLYVGGGVIKANAAQELREFAELTGVPVVTTLMALGAFPSTHPQFFRYARYARNCRCGCALQRADLLIAIGARFDASAKAPVLYVGGGVIKANAAQELREFAELTGVP
ncbi:hypothetical protein HT105_23065, partial [Bacteroides fragilis]|nr:hypothetical protein [Bacteroides fragilis]